MTNEDLALKLAACESEQAIIKVLSDNAIWDDPSRWRNFGDVENNWGSIGNQQSSADAALVEKIINSVDAMLMKECLKTGTVPSSDAAPKCIADAMEKYFNIKGGRIQDLEPSERTKLSNSIILFASGKKPNEGNPNITIVDSGEGQVPSKMPDTILSLSKSNKMRVPFVQGKFNMGGTGVLRFCGDDGFQLIITKKCPDINEESEDANLWGFTIVRRERPQDGRRNSVFTYLVDENNKILTFEENAGLPIIQTSKSGAPGVMQYGMFCKMFEYKIGSGLGSNINMRLYNRLSVLLPSLAYPVKLEECREYRANTLFRALSGLSVSLSDKLASEKSPIEEKLWTSFIIDGQTLNVTTFVYKKSEGKDAEGEEDIKSICPDGILLTLNGQTHAGYDRRFFNRTKVGLSYLADCLVVMVDCSSLSQSTVEDLFLNSRDRTSAIEFEKKLQAKLEEYFKEDDTLRSIQARRREDAIANKLSDQKPLEAVLSKIFKTSTVLSTLFKLGNRLSNPINVTGASDKKTYEGKYNPTFFTLIKKDQENSDTGTYTKEVQFSRKFRVRFKTDAENDFFSREDYPGEFSLTSNFESSSDSMFNLRDGIATLSVDLPSTASVGDEIEYKLTIRDTCSENEFYETFIAKIIPFVESVGGGGTRIPPSDDKKGNDSLKLVGISLPNVIEVHNDEWAEHGMKKESALVIKQIPDSENAYDFFVNIDNIHLLNEVKSFANDEARLQLMRARYKYAMVLIGLSIIGNKKSSSETDSEETDVMEIVSKTTEMISPVMLPIINSLGSLSIDEI